MSLHVVRFTPALAPAIAEFNRAWIERLFTLEAASVYLFTTSSLAGALRLYEPLGFEHRPLPPSTGYTRADVHMERSFPRG
jgi:hypothetical protein